jgi:CBS domain-containing protein
MKSARDIIRGQDIVTVDPAISVMEAASVMAARNIGAVPIADGDHILGIFTERDALTRIVAGGVDPSRTTVGDVMSSTLVVADVTDSYETCLDRMRQARIRHLIVLDNGRMAGIISMRDMMAVDLDDKAETISFLHAYVQGVPSDIANRP